MQTAFFLGVGSAVFLVANSCFAQHLENDTLAVELTKECDVEFSINGHLSSPTINFRLDSDYDERDEKLAAFLVENIDAILAPLTNHQTLDEMHVRVYVTRINDELDLCCIDPHYIGRPFNASLRVQRTAIVFTNGEKTWNIQKPKHGMRAQ